MQLSHKLRILRAAHNFTQHQVALSARTTQRTYSNWEQGTITPPAEKLELLAQLFNTTVQVLTTPEDIVVLINGNGRVEVHLVSALQKIPATEPDTQTLLAVVEKALKEILPPVIKQAMQKAKRGRKLKTWAGLVIGTALNTLQLAEELVPVLVD